MAMFGPELHAVRADLQASLFEYQLDSIDKMVEKYINDNKQHSGHEIESCPKCGCLHPVITRGGFSRQGKQLYECHECGHRFVHDTGTLTFYSRQGPAKWDRFIEMACEGSSMRETAEELPVSDSASFRMRQKFMYFARQNRKDKVTGGKIEMDEKYIHESRKGLIPKHVRDKCFLLFRLCNFARDSIKSISKGAGDAVFSKMDSLRLEIRNDIREYARECREKVQRGLSKDLACICTGIIRHGECVAAATNLAKPSAEDIRKFAVHVEDEGTVWTDGMNSYMPVPDEKKRIVNICPSDGAYTEADHLNNVNSFHETIEKWKEKYRGISSIYSDSYSNMWAMFYDHRGKNVPETKTAILKELNRHRYYFRVKDIMTKDIFDDPAVMERRQEPGSRISAWRMAKSNPITKAELLAVIQG